MVLKPSTTHLEPREKKVTRETRETKATRVILAQQALLAQELQVQTACTTFQILRPKHSGFMVTAQRILTIQRLATSVQQL